MVSLIVVQNVMKILIYQVDYVLLTKVITLTKTMISKSKNATIIVKHVVKQLNIVHHVMVLWLYLKQIHVYVN